MAYGEFYQCERCGATVKRVLGWSNAAQEKGQIPEGWDNIHGIGWVCKDCIVKAFGVRQEGKGGMAQVRTLPDSAAGDPHWRPE